MSISPDMEVWTAARLSNIPNPAGFNVTVSQSPAPWHLAVSSSNIIIKKWPSPYHYNATAGQGGEYQQAPLD